MEESEADEDSRKLVLARENDHTDGQKPDPGDSTTNQEDPEEKKLPQDSNEENDSEAARKVHFWELFKFADGWDVLLMLCGSTAAIGLGVAFPLISLLFGDLTDAFGQNSADPSALLDAVTDVAIKFVYLAIGAGVAGYIEMACWMTTGERQAARVRRRYLAAVLRQDMAYFDRRLSTGEVIGHMSGDIVLVQDAMGEKVGSFLRYMAQFAGGFIIAFLAGWQLALLMLATLPLLAGAGAMMALMISISSSKGQIAYGAAGVIVEECVSAIRTVAAFTGEHRAVQQYSLKLNKAFREGVKQSVAAGAGLGVTVFIMFSSYALALWYGSKMIADAGYTGGDVFTVLFGVIIGGVSLGQVAPEVTAFASGQAAAGKIFEVLERQPPIDSSSEEGERPAVCEGALELREVTFAYPSRPDVPIFQSFSLQVPAGRTMALVGESGSGKSTVVALVERFYDPQSGAVLLDGRSIAALNLRWLRQHMGLVSQEPALFNISIRDNIAYGRAGSGGASGGEISEAEIVEAARAANVHGFISGLPQGYATLVGERGVQISGGQKQRIAIARAIIGDPRLLLLDEATSALDAESEKVVQTALEKVMKNRTTLVIAHRLSTIVHADKIVVLQNGSVVEEGKHEELLAKGGVYSSLACLK